MRRQGITTLFGKLADCKDGKLISQNNNLIEVWMPDSFIEQRGKQARKSSQKAIYLAKLERDVFISSLLQPFTSGQGQTFSLRAEKSHFSLTFRQRSRIPQQKRWVAKVKVKEIQHAVKTGSSLLQFLWSASPLSGASVLCFLILSLLMDTTLAGVSAESWWLQHPLFTDVTGGIFSSHQIFTRN